MSGLFPDAAAGGVVIRNTDGVCLNPSEVKNAYCPPASFVSSCQITALPSNCNARITADQINAIQSELLALAQYLAPTGPWNCTSVQNLRNAFNVWAANVAAGSIPIEPMMALEVGEPEPEPMAMMTSFAAEPEPATLAAPEPTPIPEPEGTLHYVDQITIGGDASVAKPFYVIVSQKADNNLTVDAANGGLFVPLPVASSPIIGNGTQAAPLTLQLSTDPNNMLAQDPTGALTVPAFRIRSRAVTASMNWQKPVGLRALQIEAVAAGQDGENAIATGAGEASAGWGGNAGGYFRELFSDPAVIPVQFTIQIGTDVAVFGGEISMRANGGANGGAAFGSTLLNVPGGAGQRGYVVAGVPMPGMGGTSHFGGPKPVAINADGSYDLPAPGAGGSGVGNESDQPEHRGSKGGPALVIITEYF